MLPRLHLPAVRSQPWQQILIWSSLLVGSPAWATSQTVRSDVADSPTTRSQGVPIDQAPALPAAAAPLQPAFDLPTLPLSESLIPPVLPPCPSSPIETSEPQSECEISNTAPSAPPVATVDSLPPVATADSPHPVPPSPLKRSHLDLSARSQTAAALNAVSGVGWQKVPPINARTADQPTSLLSAERHKFGFTDANWQFPAAVAATEAVQVDSIKFFDVDQRKTAEPKAIASAVSVWQQISESNSFGFIDRPLNLAEVPPFPGSDPELGIIRITTPNGQGGADTDRDPTSPQLPCPNPDPDLGCVRIKVPPPPLPTAARAPFVFLLARMDYFRSSNIYSALTRSQMGWVALALVCIWFPPLDATHFLSDRSILTGCDILNSPLLITTNCDFGLASCSDCRPLCLAKLVGAISNFLFKVMTF